jgi:hypothetical protein
MAWLRDLPPTARHPRPRWQVRDRDEAGRERSAGTYSTKPAAQAVKRRVERGDFDPDTPVPPADALHQQKALTLFGGYLSNTWWPRWRDAHPPSAYLYGKRIEKRILPAFGTSALSTSTPTASATGRPRCSPRAHRPDHQRLPIVAGNDPQRRGRQRLPSPLADAAQERRRPRRGSQESEGAPP